MLAVEALSCRWGAWEWCCGYSIWCRWAEWWWANDYISRSRATSRGGQKGLLSQALGRGGPSLNHWKGEILTRGPIQDDLVLGACKTVKLAWVRVRSKGERERDGHTGWHECVWSSRAHWNKGMDCRHRHLVLFHCLCSIKLLFLFLVLTENPLFT